MCASPDDTTENDGEFASNAGPRGPQISQCHAQIAIGYQNQSARVSVRNVATICEAIIPPVAPNAAGDEKLPRRMD